MKTNLILQIFLGVFYTILPGIVYSKQSPNIAIIGGGIGGASSAHFVRELFGERANIDLYEAKEIGGRLAEVEVDGRPYEAGGTIIHPENLYMVNFTQSLGLEKRTSAGGRLGLYDGNEMFFSGSEWDVMLMLQFLWRYGYDMYRVLSYVKETLKDFSRIYDHQNNGYAFTSVEQMLKSMSPHFPQMMHHSCKEDMLKYGFGETFIDELAQGALRSNYGQTNKVQAFVSAVSLAGVQPGLWKVKGGNKQVPERLIKRAGANVIYSKVTDVTKLQNGIKVTATGEEGISEKEYNIVIVAAPLTTDLSQINFNSFGKIIGHYPHKYHRTVATFVKAWPNITNFGFENFNDFPTEILTTNENVFFNSIGRQTAIDFTPGAEPQFKDAPVWKVFSQLPLTDSQLNFLFPSVEDKTVKDWLAYPKYDSSEKNIPKFKLANNLYYVNTIELAASAMEMEVIGARNAALLAYNEWYGHIEKVDVPIATDIKTEL